MFLRRNDAGQVFTLTGALRAAADGSAVTTGTLYLQKDGVDAAAAGTLTHLRGGCFQYAPTQAETDCAILGYTLGGTGAVDVCGSVRTTNADPNDGVRLGLSALPNAAANASGGLYTLGGTGISLATSQPGVTIPAVGAVTGNVGGSVTSVIGDVGGKVLGGGSGTITGVGVQANLKQWDSGSLPTPTTAPPTAAENATAVLAAALTTPIAADAKKWDGGALPTPTTAPPTAAEIKDAVWDEPHADHATAGTFGAYLDAAVSGVSTGGVSTSEIAQAVLTAAQATPIYADVRQVLGQAAQPATAPPTAAEIRTEIDTNSTQLAAIKATTDHLGTALELSGSTYRFTAAALATAPTGGGGTIDTDAVAQAVLTAAQTTPIYADVRQVLGQAAQPATAVATDTSGRVRLAADGLDAISVADPGAVANMTTLPRMMVALWRRYYKKATRSSGQIRTYADNGVTVNSTQPATDDGTTQTLGAAV